MSMKIKKDADGFWRLYQGRNAVARSLKLDRLVRHFPDVKVVK